MVNFHRRNCRLLAAALVLASSQATASSSLHHAPDRTRLTTLARFFPTDRDPMSGAKFGIVALLPTRSGGALIAVAGVGRAGDGAVFRLTAAGKMSKLHSFRPKDGIGAMTTLLPGGDGSLYGTTAGGGAHDHGVFFRLTPSGNVTALYSFRTRDEDAGAPNYFLRHGDAFYGIADDSGKPLTSIAYKITRAGVFTVLYRFQWSEGITSFFQGQKGNFFGTDSPGEPMLDNILFQLTPSGRFTTLHRFTDWEMQRKIDQVIQNHDGDFYGVSQGADSVFRVTPSGKFRAVYTLPYSGTDLPCPSRLVEGRNGTLYCTIEDGGLMQAGTIFRITKSGRFILLHTFRDRKRGPHADGSGPDSLMQGRDGDFYGTTDNGGPTEAGTFFRLTPAGKLTTLCTFSASAMSGPKHSVTLLRQAPDGDWYGLTDDRGGPYGTSETLWRISP